MTDTDDSIVPMSPCISVCVLNEADICTGCYRTLDEIVDWPSMSPVDKRAVLANLPARHPANGTGS